MGQAHALNKEIYFPCVQQMNVTGIHGTISKFIVYSLVCQVGS